MIAELQEKGHINLDLEGDGGCEKKWPDFQGWGNDRIFSANIWQDFGIFHEGNLTGNSYPWVEASPFSSMES